MKEQQSIEQFINSLERRINSLQDEISTLKQDNEQEIRKIKGNMLKVKNHDHISNDQIVNSYKYSDLSCEQAMEIYDREDESFIFLDVSSKEYTAPIKFEEKISITYEELITRTHEFKNRSMRFIIISEDGTKSILASELLFEAGFYNICNISGGYLFLEKMARFNAPPSLKNIA